MISSTGIEGGSFEATAGARFGAASGVGAAAAGFGSLGGAAIPAGAFIGPCCCAESGRNRQSAAKEFNTMNTARHWCFVVRPDWMPAISRSPSVFLCALCALCVEIFLFRVTGEKVLTIQCIENACPFVNKSSLQQLDALHNHWSFSQVPRLLCPN